MSKTIPSARAFGERYRLARRSSETGDTTQLPNAAGTTPQLKQDSVLEFVAHFYNLIRDDAAMVAQLDRAVKERYAAKR